jgi:hypothetical protein
LGAQSNSQRNIEGKNGNRQRVPPVFRNKYIVYL